MLRALFSEICPSCSAHAAAGFCAPCVGDLRRVGAVCRVCGLAHGGGTCPLAGAGWRVERVLAPFVYAAPLDHYVHALKYHGGRDLGRAFGLLLAAEARAEPLAVDALVPVPLHPHRLRERGYNQATEIARTVGERLALPILLGGIRRLRDGRQLAGQSADQRLASVATAFAAQRNLHGLALAIVDDVITTGATVNALAAALLAAGARRCEAWAIARTPERADIVSGLTPSVPVGSSAPSAAEPRRVVAAASAE